MQASEPDVAAIVARTARSYDMLPYGSDPFPFTHPSQLGALARLFGLEAAAPAQARILELGCASGGNIIPLAARLPGASVVGVDLSSAQVAAGRARVTALGLTNIELRCQDFFACADGAEAPFDYIICHGVYSWVPAPVRAAILALCRKMLSPRGVALVSYNVLPGWRLLQALRDCFLVGASPDADPRQRVGEVRALLHLLPLACPEAGPYRDLLARETERLLKSPDDYIVHEFLDDVNDPSTFRDFVDAARRHGLAFLAESALAAMIADNYPASTAEAVCKLGGGNLVATEQAIDMVTGRPFRRSLLVAAEREPRIDRRLIDARVEGLHFIGSDTLELTKDGARATLAEAGGRRLHTDSEPFMAALARFVAAFPGSASIDDLVGAMPPAARNAEGRALARAGLLNMVVNGLAVACTDRVAAVAKPGARPLACPLARSDAAGGAASTVNLRHERVELGSLARIVLPLLDGSRDADAIAAAVAEIEPGTAADQVAALLPALARAALLLA
jgi:methyltransferase-like protein